MILLRKIPKKCLLSGASESLTEPWLPIARKPTLEGKEAFSWSRSWDISQQRHCFAGLSKDGIMPQASQRTSNIAVVVLAAVALAYVLVPAEYFVGLLIVVPLVGLSIATWLGYAFRKRDGEVD